jgi:hypothetical protein
MPIEERIEKEDEMIRAIQNQNRNLKKWMAGIAALALVAIVAGTMGVVRAGNRTFDVIYAKKIRIGASSGSTSKVLIGYTSNGYGYVDVRNNSGYSRGYFGAGGIRLGVNGGKRVEGTQHGLKACSSTACFAYINP